MPPALTFDDFKLISLTCELRYDSAFLIFDRTGQVIQDVRHLLPEVNVSSASPQQTVFTIKDGTFNIEIGACRFSSNAPDRKLETYVEHCKTFFDAITDHFEIKVFTRIGLRHIMRKEFKSESESQSALAGMRLANLKPTKRFNSSDSPTEVLFRWEDDQIGATVRLKAETAEVKVTLPPELRESVPEIDKKLVILTLDVDYYTVALVERDQWDAKEWVSQKVRMIKKEVNDILGNGVA